MSKQARVRPSWKKATSHKKRMKRLNRSLRKLREDPKESESSKRNFERLLRMRYSGSYDGG